MLYILSITDADFTKSRQHASGVHLYKVPIKWLKTQTLAKASASVKPNEHCSTVNHKFRYKNIANNKQQQQSQQQRQ